MQRPTGEMTPVVFHNQDISSPTMADDTLLLSASPVGLQNMLNNVYQYGRMWRIRYSTSKTKCIVFTKNKLSRMPFTWYMGNEPLEIVSQYNYLGIIITSDGSSKLRTETMTRKGYTSLGLLKAYGFHDDGLSPLTCATLWHRMLIPSMLYGCEVWGKLPISELNSLEVVQNRVAKHIQGLHRRTHNEVVRGLLGWHTMSGQVELCKLNFVRKLLDLPHTSIIKTVFISQLYILTLLPSYINDRSLTYDLWALLVKHSMDGAIVQYLKGGTMDSKNLWKQVAKASVHAAEESLWNEGLIRKHATRFASIHHELRPSRIYQTLKYNMRLRRHLMNIVKLQAFPELSEEDDCAMCGRKYTDTVEHYVMRCEGLLDERSKLWDCSLDCLSVIQEAAFLQKTDNEQLDILLSKRSAIMEPEQWTIFIKTVAVKISDLMYIHVC